MKTIIILVILAAVALSLHVPTHFTHTHEDPAMDVFENWMSKFNKVYETPEEAEYRFDVFKKNLEIVKWMQMSDDSAVYGPTQFADLTVEEFSDYYLNFKISYMPTDAERQYYEPRNDLPDSFDWREYGAVTPARSQGMCGSCWAFSAVGNLEGLYKKKTGNIIDLSTQQLVDCDTQSQGCNGGFMDWAFQYIKEAGGLQSEESYPYEGMDNQCRFDASKKVLEVTGWTFMAKDENSIQVGLVDHAPMAIALNASFLQFYFFGIFDPIWCPTSLNHGVTLVGYGDAKKPFWILKNSWGASWGEDGYFRMVRGKGKCGIDQYCVTATLA